MSNRAPSPRRRSAGDGEPSLVRVLVIAGLAAVVVLGVVLALVRGGDDDDGGEATSDRPAFGPVSVEGEPLPPFEQSTGDAATGMAAPVVRALTPDGTEATVGGAGEPTLVVFLAHWCPHCQAEVPVLVDMAEAGAFEDARLVGVLTGTNPEAPNFPPVPWLEREGWPGDVLLDEQSTPAADAFGLAGYPFMVALDGDGEVVARTSGEQPPQVIEAMLDAAGATDRP